GPDSDVDVLVTFSKDAQWSLYEWVDMIAELREIFGRGCRSPLQAIPSQSLPSPRNPQDPRDAVCSLNRRMQRTCGTCWTLRARFGTLCYRARSGIRQ